MEAVTMEVVIVAVPTTVETETVVTDKAIPAEATVTGEGMEEVIEVTIEMGVREMGDMGEFHHFCLLCMVILMNPHNLSLPTLNKAFVGVINLNKKKYLNLSKLGIMTYLYTFKLLNILLWYFSFCL